MIGKLIRGERKAKTGEIGKFGSKIGKMPFKDLMEGVFPRARYPGSCFSVRKYFVYPHRVFLRKWY